jgi:phosphinothricin acetyltransferase
MIRKATEKDAPAIAGIYNYYIEHTTITFEEAPLTTTEMGERIAHISEHFPYLVYEDGTGEVAAYAYVHTFRERAAYRYTVEDTIYVKQGAEGQGIGRELLAALIAETASAGFHAIIACVTMPNEASRGLHERAGFVPLGRFREVGYKFDRWLDVAYWEKLL